jgi:hypothetical protein
MNSLTIVLLLNGALAIAYIPIYFSAWSETDDEGIDKADNLDRAFGLLLTSPKKFNSSGKKYRLYGAFIETTAYLSWILYFVNKG